MTDYETTTSTGGAPPCESRIVHVPGPGASNEKIVCLDTAIITQIASGSDVPSITVTSTVWSPLSWIWTLTVAEPFAFRAG